jgi:hypothetical protein
MTTANAAAQRARFRIIGWDYIKAEKLKGNLMRKLITSEQMMIAGFRQRSIVLLPRT